KTTWAFIVAQLLEIDLQSKTPEQTAMMSQKLKELGVSELEDSLQSLVFGISKPASQKKVHKSSRKQSQARIDLFDKLSSETSRRIKKDAMAALRKRIGKKLNQSNDELPFWDDLEMQHGLTDSLIQFLEAFTRQTPTLIVIDDIQKENPRALNILRRIITEASDVRLM